MRSQPSGTQLDPPMTMTTKMAVTVEKVASKEEVVELPVEQPAAARGFGRRHIILMLMSLGLALAYICRINLSICIVAMTSEESAQGYQVYPWNQQERGYVLSAFFWGYVVMQVPGAALANRFGPARFILIGVSGCAFLSCLSPFAAAWGGWKALCALRLVEGLCQGVIFPCSHYMLGRWASPMERGRASAIVFTGPSLGTLLAMAGVGLLCGSPLGWPAGFYVPGVLGVVWGVMWWWLGADSPAKCKHISAEERDYIEASLGQSSSGSKRLAVPWGSILTSTGMWALICVHVCNNFGHWMLLTQMPNYMKTMLRFNIKDNGLVSALPFLTLVIASVFVGWASQRVNEMRCLSILATRKIFNSIGHYGMAASFMVLAFLTPMGVPVEVAVGLLTLAVTLESFLISGFLVNHVDQSPNFCGAMLSVSNGLGNTMGIIAPIVVSYIVGDAEAITHEELASRWSTVFYIGSAIYFTGNTLFITLGRADVQPWNNPKVSESETKGDSAEEHELLSKV